MAAATAIGACVPLAAEVPRLLHHWFALPFRLFPSVCTPSEKSTFSWLHLPCQHSFPNLFFSLQHKLLKGVAHTRSLSSLLLSLWCVLQSSSGPSGSTTRQWSHRDSPSPFSYRLTCETLWHLHLVPASLLCSPFAHLPSRFQALKLSFLSSLLTRRSLGLFPWCSFLLTPLSWSLLVTWHPFAESQVCI